MGRAVAITRLDLTAEGLRRAASVEKDGAAARRILALALILEGVDRASAARMCGMDRQTLRDWVHRYNDEGLAGLRDRVGGGRSPKLSKEQRAEFAALVEAGPDPALHKVVRWRRVDLRDEITRRFGVEVHERSVGPLGSELRRRCRQPRGASVDLAGEPTRFGRAFGKREAERAFEVFAARLDTAASIRSKELGVELAH